MPATLLIQFDNHQAELVIIGKLVMAFGELEFAVMDLVRASMGGNTEKAVKSLYRLRSESNRLELADALLTPDLRSKPFGGHWNEAYSALKCCKRIRNQYAHGHFISDEGLLRFGDMDEASASKAEKFNIQMRPIHLETLKTQLAYFEYAHHLILWLADQVRLDSGQSRMIEQKVPKPRRVPPPKLDSRGEARPPRSSGKGSPQPQ